MSLQKFTVSLEKFTVNNYPTATGEILNLQICNFIRYTNSKLTVDTI